MAKYGNVNVDENYSDILEPNLWGDSVFEPNITFNPVYQGDADAGAVKVYKQDRNGKTKPGTPGRDFSDNELGNTLITIALNNNYQESNKIYKVKANAVAYDLGEENLSIAIKDVSEGIQTSGCACLAHEGTDIGDYTAITKSNVKDYVINMRKTAKDAGAKPDVIQCSTAVYASMLQEAGDKYTPVTNDAMVRDAQVGMWMGFLWIENNLLSEEQATYYDYSDTLQTVDLSDIDFIMYDHRAFHLIDNLESMRLKDSERFTGTLAQVEMNIGFRVSNALRVLVKKNTLLEELTVVSVDGTTSGDTAITVDPEILDDHTYVYKTDASTAPSVAYDEDLSSWTAWNGTDEITATTGHKITVAEVDGDTLAKKAGNTTVASLA